MTKNQQAVRVAVIGAGPSGITALKNLLDENIDAICIEANSEVGGNWIYSDDISHSSVFETTHIISSKTLSQYADFPWDEYKPDVPDYPSHQQLAAYFQDYAKHFDLYPRIRFKTRVKHAQLTKNNLWELTIEHDAQASTETFSHMIVCNGHHWNPRYPKYPGQFDGELLHSHHFKKSAPFQDKRVLVIGGGNSACDVAVETSRVSKRTVISWRRGYRVIPKFVFGQPSDIINSRMAILPIWLRKRLTQLTIRMIVGKNKLYGLQEPDHAFGATHPTVNDELLYRIRHGKVHPKPDIEKFEGKTVYFVDGSQEEFDTIIACTGFTISHPFFDQNFINYSQGPVPLYLKMMHPEHSNLYFIGLFQPLGCIWPLSELQAKIVARELAGKWNRPQNMTNMVKKETDNPHYQQLKTPRHTITVDYHAFHRQLLKELPKDYRSKKPMAQDSMVKS